MLAQLRLNPAPRQHVRQHRELAAGALMTENGEVTVVAGSLLVLEEDEWASRTAAHAAKVDTWTAGRLERASRGRSHPVDDFLFEYYPTRPGHLRRWHPGLGVALVGSTPLVSDPGLQSPAGERFDVLATLMLSGVPRLRSTLMGRTLSGASRER